MTFLKDHYTCEKHDRHDEGQNKNEMAVALSYFQKDFVPLTRSHVGFWTGHHDGGLWAGELPDPGGSWGELVAPMVRDSLSGGPRAQK